MIGPIDCQISPLSRAPAELSVDGRAICHLKPKESVLIAKSPYPIPCIERSEGGTGWVRDIKWVLALFCMFEQTSLTLQLIASVQYRLPEQEPSWAQYSLKGVRSTLLIDTIQLFYLLVYVPISDHVCCIRESHRHVHAGGRQRTSSASAAAPSPHVSHSAQPALSSGLSRAREARAYASIFQAASFFFFFSTTHVQTAPRMACTTIEQAETLVKAHMAK